MSTPVVSFRTFIKRGTITFLAGMVILACLLPLVRLETLRGDNVVIFLSCFGLAGGAYALAVGQLRRERMPLGLIWLFAVLFRLVWLGSTPTLSDDVYRYIWDGHLLVQGVNPYAEPVNSPLLDRFQTELRAQVNHPEMASPYPPAAQAYFALVEWLRPQNPRGFQLAAIVFDLAAGWMVMLVLKYTGSEHRYGLVYLWNPLVVVEFSQGAHLDAMMLFWMIAGLYCWLRIQPGKNGASRWIALSAVSLAAGTLTKLLTALLVPLLIWRWGWRGLAIFGICLLAGFGLFAAGASWGLTGPLDGRGVFGALKIYQRYWNYNSGIYHWLEVWISGYETAGAVPVEIIGERNLAWLRGAMSVLQGFVMLGAGFIAWRLDRQEVGSVQRHNLAVLRLTLAPLGGFLLFSPTVHPWYATLVIPVLPFLLPAQGEQGRWGRMVWPWVYFSIAVGLSYLTYYDPVQLVEYELVRRAEYLPLYVLMAWACLPAYKRLGR